MAIKFTELVKKGSNSSDDKYLNMVKMFTMQYNLDNINDEPVFLPYKLDITQDCFDSNMNTTILNVSGNPYVRSIETPENIRFMDIFVDYCENLETVSLLGYTYTDASGNAERPGEFSGSKFGGCYNLTTLNLPKLQSELTYSFVSNAVGSNSLEKVIIPNVYRIGSGFFTGCNNLKLVDFRGRTSSNIPELVSASGFCQDSSVDCTIVIPDNLYDTWTHSGAWYTLYSSSNYHFVKESEYVEE